MRFFLISKFFVFIQFSMKIFDFFRSQKFSENENFQIFFDLKIFIFHTISNEKFSNISVSKIFVDRFSFWPNFLPNQAIIDRLKVLTSLGVPLSIPKRFRASRPWKYRKYTIYINIYGNRQKQLITNSLPITVFICNCIYN